MAKYEVYDEQLGRWEEGHPVKALKELLNEPHLRNTTVTVGDAVWRKKPINPALSADIEGAILCNGSVEHQVSGVLKVLEAHDLI